MLAVSSSTKSDDAGDSVVSCIRMSKISYSGFSVPTSDGSITVSSIAGRPPSVQCHCPYHSIASFVNNARLVPCSCWILSASSIGGGRAALKPSVMKSFLGDFFFSQRK